MKKINVVKDDCRNYFNRIEMSDIDKLTLQPSLFVGAYLLYTSIETGQAIKFQTIDRYLREFKSNLKQKMAQKIF